MKGPRRGGTIIIRWWYEPPSEDAVDAPQVLRGTAQDLEGKPIGHFENFEALTELMGKTILRPNSGSGRGRPEGSGTSG